VELGAAFLSASVNISLEPRGSRCLLVALVGSIEARTSAAIFSPVPYAQRAVDYLNDLKLDQAQLA
jgi:hypothetical protein